MSQHKQFDVGDVRGRVTPEEWAAREELAACYRLVAHFGWNSLIYNHISSRVPGQDGNYLINPFGLLYEEINASNLVKVDLDDNIVDDTPHRVHPAGFVLHKSIHEARPDLHCVMHVHTAAGMAVSAMKCGILPLTQNAMLFHGKIAYHDFEGLAADCDENQRVVRDLADKNILVLRNHGILVAERTVPMTFLTMFSLELALQAQVQALSSGQELIIPSEEAALKTAEMAFNAEALPEFVLDDGMRIEWAAMLRLLETIAPDYRD